MDVKDNKIFCHSLMSFCTLLPVYFSSFISIVFSRIIKDVCKKRKEGREGRRKEGERGGEGVRERKNTWMRRHTPVIPAPLEAKARSQIQAQTHQLIY